MSQKDVRGRTVFTIVSRNKVYDMLEHDNIEEIVKNLWCGKSVYYRLHEASTLYNSIDAPRASFEAHEYMNRIKRDRAYVF